MLVRSFCLISIFLGGFSPVFPQKDSIKPKHLLVFPVISSSIETGFSFGAVGSLTFRPAHKDTNTRTSNLQALVLYSTKKQLVTAINGSQYFKKESYILNEQFSYSSFPDKFWGLGNQSPESAVEPYKYQQYYIYLHLLRKIVPNLFIGAIFENQKVWHLSYLAGGIFDKQQVIGRNGYHISGLGNSITYDSRNNAFAPDKGLFGQISYNHFSNFLGSEFVYTNFVLDLRKYWAIAANKVLAMQLFSFTNSGDVPLRSLASFGGANKMRGYYDGRFKDYDLLVFQTEYRFPVYKRFSAVVFGGTGTVGRTFADYSLRDLKYSYGGGLRIAVNKKEKLNIRLDYGIGQGNNNGFYLQLGEAF